MTDVNDLTERFKDLSGELQKTVGDAIEEWSAEGRGQIRKAVGGQGNGTVLMAFIAGAIVGAIVGAAVALIMAPKSGSELREDITARAREVNGSTRERMGTPTAM